MENQKTLQEVPEPEKQQTKAEETNSTVPEFVIPPNPTPACPTDDSMKDTPSEPVKPRLIKPQEKSLRNFRFQLKNF